MLFDLILILVVVRYLKRNLSASELTPAWNRYLTWFALTSVILFLGHSFIKNADWLFEWLGHALVWYLAWLFFSKKEWNKARPILFAFLPLLAINTITDFVKLTAKSFYTEWNNYFDSAILFSVVWLVAMIIINNKQRRALQKEQVKVEEKEKEIRFTEQLKAALEVQVQERIAELVKQKEELQHTLNELKAAQTQLIHSEKMASLGELTAGIAHEIQNPLNFVNNFSEVNNELIEEMKEEMAKGNVQLAKEIADDIKQNLEKINHHGKRADGIVKSMLQHSRTGSGQKELTDINALAYEYLRLAYHGLRAKSKTFNADLKTDFDERVGKINIIPQDIGRVLLNLFTNAFYSVAKKSKQPPEGYEPKVSVITKRINNTIQVKVRDNGMGIPMEIISKVFQPFFTTKPTGQGTGLGLSLSYDIITKGHGGELKAETKEGEFAEFIISLPV